MLRFPGTTDRIIDDGSWLALGRRETRARSTERLLRKGAEINTNGKKRVLGDSASVGKYPKSVGPVAGRLFEGCPEFRAGLEKHSCPHRASVAFSSGPARLFGEKNQTLLGDPEMFSRDEVGLSGVGVSSRTSLLVHQWNDLSGRGAGKLEEKDEDMPKMPGLSVRATPAFHVLLRASCVRMWPSFEDQHPSLPVCSELQVALLLRRQECLQPLIL